MSGKKISTKAPVFEAGVSRQPSQILQGLKNFATVTSNFERNLDKEAEFVTHRTTTITLTEPKPYLPASKLTKGEEKKISKT